MSPETPSIIIQGIGTYLPQKRLTNDDLAKLVETSDEWIRTRTGIGERRLAEAGEEASDMGVRAARLAMQRAGVDPEEIDLLVVGTMSPDYPFPAAACLIQDKLGLGHVASFDVHAACSGFIYTLEVASCMLRSGNYRKALVIGAEKMSSLIDWEDRTTCILFGDGAGAVVLSRSEEPGVGVLGNQLHADGSNPSLLYMPGGGTISPPSSQSVTDREHYIKMNGKEIFKVAVRHMARACKELLERHELSIDQIDWVVPHQANVRIIESLAKHLGLPYDKCVMNIERVGNTSAASIPIALEEAVSDGRIRPGQHLLLVAFGGGLTWATSLLKWHKE